jgi:pimeloyl-ACP methyl ester carboxylesterase
VLADAGFRVAAPDVRGYGGSDKPHAIDAYAIKELSGDIAGLIAALGVQQAVVIGHDWGAPIVYATALLHPARVGAVAGLSAPYAGRGPMPSVELIARSTRTASSISSIFRSPASRTQKCKPTSAPAPRKFYYYGSGEMRKSKRPDCKSGRTGIARSPGRSRAVSALADRGRSRLLREPIS